MRRKNFVSLNRKENKGMGNNSIFEQASSETIVELLWSKRGVEVLSTPFARAAVFRLKKRALKAEPN